MKTRCIILRISSGLTWLGLTLACGAHPLDLWYSRFTNSPQTTFYSVASDGGGFVAVGNSGVMAHSTNGQNWTAIASPTTQVLGDITYGGGRYVAVGAGGTILTSSNAIDWQDHSPGTNIFLQKIRYGNSRYVAIGYTTSPAWVFSLVSTNGTNWDNYFVTSNKTINVLAFGKGLFLYPRTTGTNLLSADGITWWNQPSGTTNDLYMIGASAETLVGFDTRGHTIASADGTNWALLTTNNSLLRPEGLAYGNGSWVAGSRGTTAKYSADLVHWTAATNSQTAAYGTCFGNGTFVVAGAAICQSAPVIWLQPMAALPGAISFYGPTGVTYQIQTLDAFDGSGWQTVSNVTADTSPYLWTDPDTPGHSQRFYRAIVP